MGREVRRVPVDFDWPLQKAWEGFLLPEELKGDACIDCDGSGATTAYRWVSGVVRLLLALDDDLLAQSQGRGMHPWFEADSLRPSPDIHELVVGLTGRELSGHGAIDNFHATEKIINAAGLPDDWGECKACDGDGYTEKYPGQRVDALTWEPTDPPDGEGYQLWETVTEGSPISPVFSTKDGLIDWLSSEYRPIDSPTPMTRDQAERFVDAGWAPSAVYTPATGIVSGEVFVGMGND